MPLTFKLFLESDDEEIWRIRREDYVRPWKERFEQLDREYQQVLQRYGMPQGERPTTGDYWSRYGHDVDVSGALTQVRWWHKKLLKQREKAMREMYSAESRHRKAVEKAVKRKLPVPPEVLQDYGLGVMR
jgi:hypothetical protein